jgi:hypothetical protein
MPSCVVVPEPSPWSISGVGASSIFTLANTWSMHSSIFHLCLKCAEIKLQYEIRNQRSSASAKSSLTPEARGCAWCCGLRPTTETRLMNVEDSTTPVLDKTAWKGLFRAVTPELKMWTCSVCCFENKTRAKSCVWVFDKVFLCVNSSDTLRRKAF